ncbi:MAG TPA: peptidylprolyl isomerase [Thermoanaerobaculia bacterium]|nr:peptidylprolyl isomerase [Thermoanaerobaculia bacterium]
MRRSLFMTLLLALAACTAAPPPSDLPDLEVPDLDTRAMLLLLVDRQIYEPVIVEHALRGGPELREDLAVSMGRIPDPRAGMTLVGLLLDDVPAVRRAAAFGLGEVEDPKGPKGKEQLLKAVRDPDHEVGLLAVEALGKLGVPVVEVVEALLPLDEAERWARLLPPLFRFREEQAVTLAARGLAQPDRELHARAAYALAREPRPEGLPHLRPLVADPDPRVRAWAARGLGLAGGGEDLAALRPLLDDAEPGPVIQALRAARTLITQEKATAPADWRPRLAELVSDPRPGVRITALEAAGAWPLRTGDALAAAVESRAAAGPGREREVAVVAAAAGEHPRAAELAAAAAGSPETALRARAAEAAGLLVDEPLLARLAADPEPAVRSAALEARLAIAGDAGDGAARGAELARAALTDTDPAVLGAALGWLADHPVVPLDVLDRAAAAALLDPTEEPGLAAIRALVARAKAEPRERGALIALLEKVTAHRRYALRREAGAGLGELERPVPVLGPADDARPFEVYREMVQRTRRPRTVEVRTGKGTVRVRLACPEAPLTCLNFLQLAGQGYYDGLRFHRVVPDFVAQGGDPRGDGVGGPGYSIRDEINRLRYERGAVGMALAGPDTGGSQFFFTLTPQPHLDGGYTVFGQVVAGDEVLDQLVQGDRIESVREVAEGGR